MFTVPKNWPLITNDYFNFEKIDDEVRIVKNGKMPKKFLGMPIGLSPSDLVERCLKLFKNKNRDKTTIKRLCTHLGIKENKLPDALNNLFTNNPQDLI